MADVVDPATRSRMMAGIRGKNTRPELLIRKALHARGFRYRIHCKDLPGNPDLCFPKYRAVIFVHGCFWHRCPRCALGLPKSNTDYWSEKFERNVERDRSKETALLGLGWKVHTVWECDIHSGRSDKIGLRFLQT